MFVRYVSHEIRTPLNTIQVGLDFLKKSIMNINIDPDTLNHSEIIETIDDLVLSTDIAINVLNELLNYEKLQSGLMKLELKVISAYPFLLATIQPFEIQVWRYINRYKHICYIIPIYYII